MATLIYSKPSLKDIETIKNFISAGSVANAHRFIKIIRAKITVLKKYPKLASLFFLRNIRISASFYINRTELFTNFQTIK